MDPLHEFWKKTPMTPIPGFSSSVHLCLWTKKKLNFQLILLVFLMFLIDNWLLYQMKNIFHFLNLKNYQLLKSWRVKLLLINLVFNTALPNTFILNDQSLFVCLVVISLFVHCLDCYFSFCFVCMSRCHLSFSFVCLPLLSVSVCVSWLVWRRSPYDNSNQNYLRK